MDDNLNKNKSDTMDKNETETSSVISNESAASSPDLSVSSENTSNDDSASDKKNIGELSVVNFELPTGCLIQKTSLASDDSKEKNNVKKEKIKKTGNKFFSKLLTIMVVLLGLCIIVFGAYMAADYKVNKSKESKDTIILDVTSNDNKENETDTTTEFDVVEEVRTEEVSEITVEPITEAEISTESVVRTETEENTEFNIQSENTTEDVVNESNNTIVIGGVDVSYEFDDAWESKIENNTFYAERNIQVGSIVLYVCDSNIDVGKTNNVQALLESVDNPFANKTDMILEESKKCEMINVNGKTGYITYYVGKDKSGHTITSLGMLQDIDAKTYAYITVKDSCGYDIQSLIDSLAISIN